MWPRTQTQTRAGRGAGSDCPGPERPLLTSSLPVPWNKTLMRHTLDTRKSGWHPLLWAGWRGRRDAPQGSPQPTLGAEGVFLVEPLLFLGCWDWVLRVRKPVTGTWTARLTSGLAEADVARSIFLLESFTTKGQWGC